MIIGQEISMVLPYKSISQTESARKIGTTPPNPDQKVKRNTLTKEELENIANSLGAPYRTGFIFPDGTIV